MIDFWIFPLSTIWGAYQNTGVAGKGSKLSRGLEPPTSALPRRRATDCAKTAYCVPTERKVKYTLLEFDCQVKADLNPAKS